MAGDAPMWSIAQPSFIELQFLVTPAIIVVGYVTVAIE
jgi:hypothetical protein